MYATERGMAVHHHDPECCAVRKVWVPVPKVNITVMVPSSSKAQIELFVQKKPSAILFFIFLCHIISLIIF